MRKTLLGIGAFVLAGLMLWGLLAWRDGVIRKDFALKLTGDSLRTEEKAKKAALRERDSAFAINLQQRVVYRDRVLAGNSPTIPRTEVERIVRECRATEADCAAQRKAAQELIDNLRGQVTNLSQQKARKPPRFSTFAEGGWDFVQREPVVRGGGEVRIAGPLSLTVTGEASAGLGESRARVLAALKFTFR